MADLNEERLLDWDDEIEAESEFVLLPDGVYEFQVIKVEKTSQNKTEKLPACKKAVVHCKITDGSGNSTTCSANFFMIGKLEWKISELFRCIGLKKKGEKCKMNWNDVEGRTGWLKLGHRNGTGSYAGQTFNDIQKFIPPERVEAEKQSAEANESGADW